MAGLSNSKDLQNKYSFVIQSMELNGSSWKEKVLKDKDGFYTMPGFVFNKPSRNGKIYDAAHMVDCVTNPNTRFYRMLTESTLHGEYGHPISTDFKRMCKIKEQRYALFISKIYTSTLRDGTSVINVKFRPVGPYGKFFQEALDDPIRNSCLSVRVVCKDGPVQGQVMYLYPKIMITFDGVGGGGFLECSKSFVDGERFSTEDMYIPLNEPQILSDIRSTNIYTENLESNELLDFLRADSATIKTKLISSSVNIEEIKAIKFHSLFK